MFSRGLITHSCLEQFRLGIWVIFRPILKQGGCFLPSILKPGLFSHLYCWFPIYQFGLGNVIFIGFILIDASDQLEPSLSPAL